MHKVGWNGGCACVNMIKIVCMEFSKNDLLWVILLYGLVIILEIVKYENYRIILYIILIGFLCLCFVLFLRYSLTI